MSGLAIRNKSLLLLTILAIVCPNGQAQTLQKLKVSANHHYLVKENGDPFFWLGDTGWLLFRKLNREDAEKYLEDRRRKGFNVIQTSVVHGLNIVNAYGDSALVNRNVATPKVTKGNNFSDAAEYDYWDHVDFIIDLAAKKGLYIGIVPVWGTNVKNDWVSASQAKAYATFLAQRYKDKPNIIWMNGGDIQGSVHTEVWKTIGNTIRSIDKNHLITFHPFGRTSSSQWFHNEPWLDFNMFQSGHRSYEQETTPGENRFGPDNYKFLLIDYNKKPIKPSLDGEPSYEEIPYGLHDTTQPRWTDNDVRRYGYWEVFAGGAGYTYGHNAVMQMRQPADKSAAYGSHYYWYDAINHPGAGQMQYLKKLMLSKPYLERVPDQSLVSISQGKKYEYLAAMRGKDYAFVYCYTGRDFSVQMGKISGKKVKASWYSPRDGSTQLIGTYANESVVKFNPPGEPKDGNDWVLVLENAG